MVTTSNTRTSIFERPTCSPARERLFLSPKKNSHSDMGSGLAGFRVDQARISGSRSVTGSVTRHVTRHCGVVENRGDRESVHSRVARLPLPKLNVVDPAAQS